MQQRNRLLAGRRARRRTVSWLRAHHGRNRRGDRRVTGGGRGEVQAAIDQRRAVPAGSVFPGPSWRYRACSKRIWRCARRSTSRMTFLRALAAGRERDRAAGRALEGPHRSDLDRRARPKEMPGRSVLHRPSRRPADRSRAGARRSPRACQRPRRRLRQLLLLDEIAAHLDPLAGRAVWTRIVARWAASVWMFGHRSEALCGAVEIGPRITASRMVALARLD
jgi:DNA replication and repair protein RecF